MSKRLNTTLLLLKNVVGPVFVALPPLMVTLFGALDLVMGSVRMARIHEDLYRRFIGLEKEMATVKDELITDELVADFTTKRLEIEADPTTAITKPGRVFGAIEGVVEGQVFESRAELSRAGVHRPNEDESRLHPVPQGALATVKIGSIAASIRLRPGPDPGPRPRRRSSLVPTAGESLRVRGWGRELGGFDHVE